VGGGYISNSLLAGTPIAVFGRSATLTKPADPDAYDSWVGSGHVAIFLGELTDQSGIMVMDQNYGTVAHALAIHTIPWNSDSSDKRTIAGNYRVVMY